MAKPDLPTAYGSDRVHRDGDRLLIESRWSKAWNGRTPAARGERQHPGTAVEWDGALYEVVSAERVASGIRYELRPWPTDEAVRRADVYNERSETARRISRATDARREQRRRSLAMLPLLTGQLPAHVQERLHLEYGLAPVAPTVISAIPLFVIGVVALIFFLAAAFGAPAALPMPAMLLCAYFFGESLTRVTVALNTQRPMGSILGVVAYAIWTATAGGGATSPRELSTTVAIDVEEAQLHRDRIRLLEPFASLLPRADQELIAARYAIDLHQTGWRTAAVILLLVAVTVLGQFRSMSAGPVTPVRLAALALNIYLILEQLVRLSNYAERHLTGSILGLLVRPLFRRQLVKH